MADFDPIPPAPPVKLRRFDDVDTLRSDIYDQAKKSFETMRPVANLTHRLEVSDVGYDDGEYNPSIAQEKAALLKGGSLARPLHGTVKLIDQATNAPVDERRMVLANIPHMNTRGLFIRNGVVWSLRNQQRLRPGIYTRRQNNGGVEAMVNVKPGTGRSFRMNLEPESGLLKLQIGQSTTRLYPVMKALGYSDDQMKEAWGDELFQKNQRDRGGHDTEDLKKVVRKLGKPDLEIPDADLPQALKDILGRAEVDEDTTELTLGKRIKHLNPEVLLHGSKKVLAVARDQDPGDNRDSQAFQSIHSGEDFIRDRLSRDQAGVMRKALWRAGRTGKLDHLQTGAMNKNLNSLFEGSGLSTTPEQINPFETYDQRQAITRLGEGGISSTQSVSRDARNVQPSYLGSIDAGREPESANVGLDMRVTDSALKGSDNQLYTMVKNLKTGELEPISTKDLASKKVALPGELKREGLRTPVVHNNQIKYVPKGEVDYELEHPNQMMSRASAMIPAPQSIEGKRQLMGARATQQALPLQNPEAPLVQTAGADGESLHKSMGVAMGAIRAAQPGTVMKVDEDNITVRQADGTAKTYELYNNYPHSRKSALHNTASVKVGDPVDAGQLLAKSNYTDDHGTMALGKNLRTAFMVAHGNTIEDALVLSESAARKLTSESMYKTDLDLKGIHSTDLGDFKAVYSDKFKPEQYAKIGDDGVIKVGQEVHPGDPLVLAIGNKPKRGIGALMETPRAQFSDKTQLWDHNAPGTVTDVQRTRSGIKVFVKSYDASQIADKISGLYGNKGVISEIRPDEQMPHDAQGRPVEVVMNALGTVSRKNPGALVEGLLGRVAEKTGKPYVLKPFDHQDMTGFALDEAVKHGVIGQDAEGNPVETQTVTDPSDGRQIHNVFVGNSYLMKLHHQSEGKLQARDSGTYTSDNLPAKGGFGGSKRIAVLDTGSLLSSGATEFLRDAKLIRGQRNDDYWRSLRAGDTPVEPTETFANNKFKDMLTAAGVNLRERGSRTQLAPLLDREVDAMADHEIENGKTLDFESLEPEPGGLFDVSKTGGVGGHRFAKITLPEKVPHPLFVDAIQKLLGLTGKKLDAVLSSKDTLNGDTGPKAVEDALKGLNVDREIQNAKQAITTGTQTAKDVAVKKLNYLTGLQNTGTKPDELMVSKIPVIPPKHRPVITGQNVDVVHDLNYLYHDLLESKKNYADAKGTFGQAGDEYLTMAHAVGAISGLRDPVNPKTHEQGVKGVLKSAIGIGDSPKGAVFQYKVIGSAVDQVGRGTITADKNLDMDQVSIPKAMAWEIFRPYVIRQLRRQGMPATEAMKAVREQSPQALEALKQEMTERPVVYNRAPALHRFAYTGAYAKLRDDDAIGLPYATLKGLGGDYDGDAINVHTPSSAAAVEEVKNKLLPSTALRHPGTFETHYEPVQDYLAGLHLATTPDPKQRLQVFHSEEEAKAAYKRGDISARTPIRILPG